MLFYQSSGQPVPGTRPDGPVLDLSQNQRLNLSYQVLSFSPNRMILSVDTKDQAGVWMQYCDIWHPFWKASINGQSQKIYRGNLAYKALPLHKGPNIVHLYFESKFFVWLYHFFMLGSLIWMVLLIWLLVI